MSMTASCRIIYRYMICIPPIISKAKHAEKEKKE